MKQKFQGNLSGEISGSIGDLGTFLPYVIGAITIGGLDATGVFLTFGLLYILSGWFYRVPVPVQPMKVMGAAILVHQLTAGEVAAAGILTGATLLLLGFTGLVDKLARITPDSVTNGIQVGLGISLAVLGVSFIKEDPWLGGIVLVAMLLLFGIKKVPVAVIAVLGGTLLGFVFHPQMSFPQLSVGFYLPQISWPAWADFNRGFTLAFLPQLPLTLTNSVLVTAALAHELFPDTGKRVTEKNLCLTLGVGNLLAMPLGGFPMCHGSGGLAGHYRFGGRTGLTVGIIGAFLVGMALFLGPSGVDLLGVIPRAVLGGLLFFSGVDLVRSFRGWGEGQHLYTFIVVVILSVALNPGIAFLAGLILAFLTRKGWLSL